MSWRDDDVERWLNDYPLPVDFLWRGQRVWPRYQLKKGYGFWLRTTPYHQGLFEICRDILVNWMVGQPMPDGDQLAVLLKRFEIEQGLLPLDAPKDDQSESPKEPNGNPTETHF